METPDITKAQIGAVALAVFGLLAALGLPVSKETQDAILNFVYVVPTILVAADTLLRMSRARMHAKIKASENVLGLED